MSLFGDKKNRVPKAGVKEPKEPKKSKKKKNSEEDVELLDENPAFQYAPAIDAASQEQSLIDEPPVQNLIANQQNTQVDPQTLSQAPVVDPSVVSQVVDPSSVQNQVMGFDPVSGQPAAIDPNTGLPIGSTQPPAIDPITGLPVAAQPVAIDPNTGLPVAEQPMAIDPNTGLPIAGQPMAIDPNTGLPVAEQPMAIDPNTGLPIAGQPMAIDPNTGLPIMNQPNYNSPLSGSIESSVPGEVRLPDEVSVLADNHKVQRPVKRYKYTIINTMGKKESGPFEAETEEDVRNFLLSQDYQVLEVKERSSSDIDIGGNGKISSADLSFCLTQLSTYLKSGIPLSDAVKILAKQSTKSNLKHHFNQLVYELLKGENLSDAMELQGAVFPKLLINMVKTAEMTGDLPSILDDMAEYYTSMDQTRKQMKSAMTYPAVVLTIAFGVLIFMLTYLVPQFTDMFEQQGAELPALTQAIVGVSDFIRTKWYILLGVIVAIVVSFILCYTKIKKFRTFVQTFLMHIPVINNIIIYNEMANFAKTFASLLNHSVFITDSMEILSKITNNEIYKGIIDETLEHLSKGDSISASFKGKWAIPVVAYEMIVTGESTGQLGAMMEKVASHFQMLHKNVIDQMKSLVEPVMICFLAVVVGIILVSIIQPMFSIYSQIK